MCLSNVKEKKLKGCFKAGLVRFAYWIDLQQTETRRLSFVNEMNGRNPLDEAVLLAHSAARNSKRMKFICIYFLNISMFADVAMYFCNQEEYGFMMRQLKMDQTIEDDYNELLNVKLAASGNVMRAD